MHNWPFRRLKCVMKRFRQDFLLKYQAMFKLGRGLKKSFFWKRNLKATGLQPQIFRMSLTSVLLTSDVPLRTWSIPKYTTPWPIRRGHVVSDNFPVPECLVRFFTGVLLGNCSAANPFTRIQMLVNSFSQDLIYATSVAKANLLNTFCCRILWLKM